MTGAPGAERSDRASEQPGEPYILWPSQLVAAEAVGRVTVFWGFTRSMGRIWATLYLSDRPLTARELREGLGLSVGAVSMTLAELERWGLVQRVKVSGSRSRHFEAETRLWRMITRVLEGRERVEVANAVAAFRRAIDDLRERTRDGDPETIVRARHEERRLRALLDLSGLASKLIDALVASERLERTALVRFLLRR